MSRTNTEVVPVPTMTYEPIWRELKELDDRMLTASDVYYLRSMDVLGVATAPATIMKRDVVASKEYELKSNKQYYDSLLQRRTELLNQLGY